MPRRFGKVAVLMGGPSAEREVSLASGRAVSEGLRRSGYDVSEVDPAGRSLDLPAGTEAVFIALHGEFGEDGVVQALLNQRGIPYTGAGAEASRKAFDKVVSKEILDRAGIPTAPYEVLRQGGRRTLALPVVTKPARQGSTIGLRRVLREEDWEDALAEAFSYDEEVVVEEYIAGRELTVGILGDQVLPSIEIVAPDSWYDYEAKYTSGACRYLAPAPVEDAVSRRLAELAMGTYRALDCRGFGRVDYRVANDGAVYVLEINTIPGFTQTSLLPKAAAALGIGFDELCDRIMNLAATDHTR